MNFSLRSPVLSARVSPEDIILKIKLIRTYHPR
nr:MAG TPA_asm: hypothetical protein [Caudoviricetes sp.]